MHRKPLCSLPALLRKIIITSDTAAFQQLAAQPLRRTHYMYNKLQASQFRLPINRTQKRPKQYAPAIKIAIVCFLLFFLFCPNSVFMPPFQLLILYYNSSFTQREPHLILLFLVLLQASAEKLLKISAPSLLLYLSL